MKAKKKKKRRRRRRRRGEKKENSPIKEWEKAKRKEREPIVQLKCGKFKFLPNKGSKHPKRKSFLFYS